MATVAHTKGGAGHRGRAPHAALSLPGRNTFQSYRGLPRKPMKNFRKPFTDGPSRTPWGKPQQVEVYAPGIIEYRTASHGGFWISKERRREMPESYRSAPTWAGGNWYEEDHDWCLVYLSFPEVFQKCDKRFAERTKAAENTFNNFIKPDLNSGSIPPPEDQKNDQKFIKNKDNDMTEFAKPQKGYETPWGKAQQVKEIAPGIVWCSTAGHGGYWISEKRRQEMPHPYRSAKTFAGGNWYEEDCDWCLVYLAFPEVFQKHDGRFAENTEAAKRTFDRYIRPDLPEMPEASKTDAPTASETDPGVNRKEEREACSAPGEKGKGKGRVSSVMSR